MRILILLIPLLLCSCTTTKYADREIPIENSRIEYIDRFKIDSIYIHDSTDNYIAGDTVYRYKYRYIYKYINRVDTVLRIDSIGVPIRITEVTEVNKLNNYQKALMALGCVLAISLLYKIIKSIHI